ncbi:DJ-1/PfpI family protein [Corynebacterium sp. HMSC14H10]|uniref:DJ-1/PfpI family protein n=1 Tax=Corynebacterium sp. HMSC14H10 TaxID=1581103 RepID=UPI00210FDF6A|nr:DJ-1/PfpI family protein [Corynebacterium sp. HMSC14H10]
MTNQEAHRRVTVVLFPGFELLDVFGPVGLFGHVPEIEVEYVANIAGPITSAQGAQVIATRCATDLETVDILLVPGGAGSRTLVDDAEVFGLAQQPRIPGAVSGIGLHRFRTACCGWAS